MRRIVPIAILIALADQFAKLLVLRWVDPEYPVEVIDSFFRLVNWGNTGAAWGMFQGQNMTLAIASLIIMVVLFFFRHSFQIERVMTQISFGLITGGIVGNLVDRFRCGHVIDFLDFSLRNHHWPAFNVADSAICIGVGIYILGNWNCVTQPVPSNN